MNYAKQNKPQWAGLNWTTKRKFCEIFFTQKKLYCLLIMSIVLFHSCKPDFLYQSKELKTYIKLNLSNCNEQNKNCYLIGTIEFHQSWIFDAHKNRFIPLNEIDSVEFKNIADFCSITKDSTLLVYEPIFPLNDTAYATVAYVTIDDVRTVSKTRFFAVYRSVVTRGKRVKLEIEHENGYDDRFDSNYLKWEYESEIHSQ